MDEGAFWGRNLVTCLQGFRGIELADFYFLLKVNIKYWWHRFHPLPIINSCHPGAWSLPWQSYDAHHTMTGHTECNYCTFGDQLPLVPMSIYNKQIAPSMPRHPLKIHYTHHRNKVMANCVYCASYFSCPMHYFQGEMLHRNAISQLLCKMSIMYRPNLHQVYMYGELVYFWDNLTESQCEWWERAEWYAIRPDGHHLLLHVISLLHDFANIFLILASFLVISFQEVNAVS